MEMVGTRFCAVCRRMGFNVRRFSLLLEMNERNEPMTSFAKNGLVPPSAVAAAECAANTKGRLP